MAKRNKFGVIEENRGIGGIGGIGEIGGEEGLEGQEGLGGQDHSQILKNLRIEEESGKSGKLGGLKDRNLTTGVSG